MNQNSNGMSTGMAIICTIGIMLFIGLIIDLNTPKCIKSGCDNDAKDGSSYCYLHDDSYYRNKGNRTSYSGSTNSSGSSSSTKSSSASSSEKSSGTSSSSKKSYSSGSSGNRSSKKKSSSTDSYDDGYNAVYEDDDYDWDRYRSDDDYATGVDDAMEDEEW